MNIIVISTKGVLDALANQMILEGDKVIVLRNTVSLPEELHNAELILTDKRLPKDIGVPVIGGDEAIPIELVKAMGYKVNPIQSDFFVFKWFDSLGGWGTQTILGFSLNGHMDQGLGLDTPSGIGLRYVSGTIMEELFSNMNLITTLKKLCHNGFVSFGCSFTKRSFVVNTLSTNPPLYSIFAVMEGCGIKISEFFSDPLGYKLMESWSVGLLLSRCPWPVMLDGDRVFLGGLNTSILKHFWMFNVEHHRSSYFTSSTLLGVATAWSPHLAEANRRVLRTCHNIDVPHKQHRTDLATIVQSLWGKVRDRKLV